MPRPRPKKCGPTPGTMPGPTTETVPTQPRRRHRTLRRLEENPGRRFPVRQVFRKTLWKTGLPVMPRRHPGRRRKSIRRSAENCNGHGCKNCAPVPPAGNLGQIVRPHQPDKAITGKNTPQGTKRINRVAGFKLRFEIRHPDAGVPGNGPGTGHAFCQRRHAFFRLQWILR